MRDVPYFTTDDESRYCGHMWKQRREIGGPWGFAWSVIPPYGDDENAVDFGWQHTQELAEAAMREALSNREAQ